MVMMPMELPDVTLESARADLARWVVSLRRADAAGTRRTTGQLAVSLGQADDPEAVGYCCLGIWCEIQHARGLVSRDEVGSVRYFAGPEEMRNSSTLPKSIRLAGSDNPDLLHAVARDNQGEDLVQAWRDDCYDEYSPSLEEWVANNTDTYCAADLNDDLGLPFGQIADIVVWRFQLTPEELAAAELEPRVELVEGPAEEPAADQLAAEVHGVAYDGPGTVPF